MNDETEVKLNPRKCSRCQSMMFPITPMKGADGVYGCSNCGNTIDAQGNSFIKDIHELKTLFRAPELASKKIEEFFSTIKTKPSNEVRALFTRGFMEYGLTMWFDGFQSGQIQEVIRENYESTKERGDEDSKPEGLQDKNQV